MHWKLKLVVLGMFCVWCVLLWFISSHVDWHREGRNVQNVQNALISDMAPVRKDFRRANKKSETIQVFIATDENSVGGMIAAINSIVSNTKNPVHFYLVTNHLEVRHLTSWLQRSKLSNVKYSLKTFPFDWIKGKVKIGLSDQFPNYMDFAKVYIPQLFPQLKGILVYLDNDVIVQGDIAELAATPIPKGLYGAFSDDCQSVSKQLSSFQNTYTSYVNFNNVLIRKLKMKPTSCSFNVGVFVVNMTMWRSANITAQLDYWIMKNRKDHIYISEGSQGPFLIVFYKKFAQLDPLWHVRHLGVSGVSHYSMPFLKVAKLLHWDGHYKPWSSRSANTDLWDKYYIPDPSGHYKPIRKN